MPTRSACLGCVEEAGGGGGELAQLWPCLPAPGSCYATGLASAALYVSSQTKPAQPRGKQAKNALGWAFLGPTRMGLMALKVHQVFSHC